LKAVNIKLIVFWDMTSCSLVEGTEISEELATFSVEVGEEFQTTQCHLMRPCS